MVSLEFVPFEGLGGGDGHVLEVGDAVTVHSVSVGTRVIVSSKVLSWCDCLFWSTGMHDGFAWLLVDGLAMHLRWSCDDSCMVSMWNVLLPIGSDLLVF